MHTFERLAAWDRVLCRRFNGASEFAVLRIVLVAASRLGNGVFWYALMGALLVWGGEHALAAIAHMFGMGVACTAVYKGLKTGTSRQRPYAVQPGITLCAAPLDQYSFPSGHTLHAVNFTLLACAFEPWLAVVLAPFAMLVAASRVVLGLHYPSDVAAGALLGAAIASVSMLLWPI